MTVSLRAPRLVMFDLDGTLVDTAPDIAFALDQTLTQLGRAPAGEQCVRGWLGEGFESLLRRALSSDSSVNADQEVEEDLYQKAVDLFPDIYMHNLHRRSDLYPGAHDCLQKLQDQRLLMACVTNKSERFSEKLLHSLGIADYFSVIVSGDTLLKRKPDPEPLHWTMRRLDVSPADALMVGDSDNDVKAARAAGAPVVGVSYGYCQGGMHALQPDVVVDSLCGLTDLFT